MTERRTVAALFDEIGDAIAAIEADANAHGLTGQMLGARDCLRAVAAIRARACMTCGSTAPKTDIGACRRCAVEGVQSDG